MRKRGDLPATVVGSGSSGQTQTTCRLSRPFGIDPMWGFEPKGSAVQARMVVALPQDGVGFNARSNDKQGLWLASDLQPLRWPTVKKWAPSCWPTTCPFRCQRKGARVAKSSTTRRSVKHGMVTTDLDDVAALDLKLLLQEIGQTDFADETQALRIFFVCCRQSPMSCRDLSHLSFVQLPNGKKGTRQLCLVQLAQEIALVFVSVCPRQVMNPLVVGHFRQ